MFGQSTRKPIETRHVVESDMIDTLAIDFNNYQVFYPNSYVNTMMSMNLDGTNVEGM